MNDGLDEELEFYDEIIDCFFKFKDDAVKMEICKNRSINKSMNILNRRSASQLVRNALILILNLFGDEHRSPDLLTSLGKDSTLLNEVEKDELLLKLRKELSN